MKRLYPILILICFSACEQKKHAGNPVALQDYKKAYAFYGRQNDSAFFYFNRLAGDSKDNLQIATAYNYMAAIQSDAGDYFGAQESLSLSLKYLDTLKKSHRACLTSDYNELGLTNLDLKTPATAVPFFEKAIQLTDNPSYRDIYLNNKALAYQQNGAYAQALSIYRMLTRRKVDQGSYARILTNTTMSEWNLNKAHRAAPALLTALSIRRKLHDNWGLNSSFANLATYYEEISPDSSLWFAQQQYLVATRLNSPDDRLNALQKLTELSRPNQARSFFRVYRLLNDSLQKARNAAKNQFALIRFNVERKEADNLKLQQEYIETSSKLAEQRWMLLFVAVLVLAGGAYGLIWYRKREQSLLLVSRQKELRLSQRVHDVVANGLYKLMSDMENKAGLEKESFLDEIEMLYEQSRDISYEPVIQYRGLFAQQLRELAASFSGDTIRIAVSGNDPEVWAGVTQLVGEQVIRVVQELFVNMSKHSNAHLVALKIQRRNEAVMITLLDDGVGMPSGVKFGNGLKSTVSRIQTINGTIKFAPNLPSGLVVDINFPVA